MDQHRIIPVAFSNEPVATSHFSDSLAPCGRAGQPGPQAENREPRPRGRAVEYHDRVPIRAMTGEVRNGLKTQLAFAIAQGKSVAMWARDRQVPRSTAFRWANDPNVRCAVESRRRRALDRVIDRMARCAKRACHENVKLAKAAESESAKLRALRAIFSDVFAVSKPPDMKHRIAKIEQRLRDQADDADISRARFAGTYFRANGNHVAVDGRTALDVSPVAAPPARWHSAATYLSGQTLELSRKSDHIVSFHKPCKTPVWPVSALRMSFRRRGIRSGLRRFGESESLGGMLMRKKQGKSRRCSLPPGQPFLLPPQPVRSGLLTTSQGVPCPKQKNP